MVLNPSSPSPPRIVDRLDNWIFCLMLGCVKQGGVDTRNFSGSDGVMTEIDLFGLYRTVISLANVNKDQHYGHNWKSQQGVRYV